MSSSSDENRNMWCWRKDDERDKTKLVCHVFNCNGITARLPTLYKGGPPHHEKVNTLRKCFVFWTIMFAVFFHDIFLPRSVYLIILYNVLAGQDCNLVFFKSSIDFITHLLCLLLSSTCLHVSFLFNLSHTGFQWFGLLIFFVASLC